jgi:hypothetical protein
MDLAFADREHANLHEACPIDITSGHIAQSPTWGARDASNARPDLAVTGPEITADTMLADLKDGRRPAHSFDHTKEEALRAALAGVFRQLRRRPP